MINFFRIIKQATISVPATKYAVGIAGMAAVIALIVSFNIDFRIALWGIFVLLILMVLLAVFARLAQTGSEDFRLPAKILMWSMVILFIGASLLLTTSVFFKKPLDLQFVLLGNKKEIPILPKIDSTLNNKPKDSIPTTSNPIRIHLVSTESDSRKKFLDKLENILLPLVDRYNVSLVQKTISENEPAISKQIHERPAIIVIHLHAYGKDDNGLGSKLGELLSRYLAATPDSNIQFVVYSASFDKGKSQSLRNNDVTKDTTLKNRISTIYLPYPNEQNFNNYTEELRKLVEQKILVAKKRSGQ